MADTDFDAPALYRALRALTPARRLLVAYSGGLDSQVLLHALVALARGHALQVAAIHIDHGLQAQASRWAAHCARVCRDWRVPLRVVRVDATARDGASPEQAARQARYDAFAAWLQPGQELLTAHTADDQAETVLLRLLRGSGVRGAAGVRARRALGRGQVSRPLLGCTRRALAGYARDAGLQWIEDPSNADLRFERNFVRHAVLPLLRQRWPAASATLVRDAAQFAAAAELLDEVAAQDLAGAAREDRTLSLAVLAPLGEARRDLVLREWLRRAGGVTPATAQLAQLHGLCRARPDRQPALRLGALIVRRYRERLYLEAAATPPPPATLHWDLRAPLPLPGCARTLTRTELERLGLHLAPGTRVEVRFRRGGERIRLAGHAHHKALKKLFQEHGVPPWRRHRVPLIYVDGELAAVIGIGAAARFCA